MIEIGRLCIKIAGRDAGKKCVIVDILKNNYALVDGETRRRKCNLKHLEPLNEKIEIKKGATHEELIEPFRNINIELRLNKPKPKTERPKKQKGKKELKEAPKEKKPKKTKKKEAKTENKKEDNKKVQKKINNS